MVRFFEEICGMRLVSRDMECFLRALVLVIALFFGVTHASAQKSPAGQTPSGGPTGSPSTLAGITYPAKSLPTAAPLGKHIRTLCFDLVNITDSPTQPFILVPAASTFGRHCSPPDDDHPLVFGDLLVIAVAIPDPANPTVQAVRDSTQDTGGFNRILALSLNVTSQTASPINPAPVRPTITTSSGGAPPGGPGPGAAPPTIRMATLFYLKWPNSLLADTVPTVNVSAVYEPPLSSTKVQTTTEPPAPGPGVDVTVPSTQTVTTVTLEQIPSGAQIVNLQNLVLPQVHALYYYNVSTGVAVTFKRNPTFLQVPSSPGSSTFKTTSTAGDYLVNPLVLFTVYFPPMDAERRWNAKNLIPGLSWGLSLSSPSSSFYIGPSFEIRRNVQFITGVNIVKITSLAPVPQTTSTPVTQQNFKPGGFVGLTVNIDFIKALFGGGGKTSQ